MAEKHFLAYLKETGQNRMFWASDCPFVGHEEELELGQTIKWLENLVDDSAVADKIFGHNALSFYFPEIS